MTEPDQDFLAGLMDGFLERFVARLKDEGLVHDDRPPLTLEEAAARLNVSRRAITDLTSGPSPMLATVKLMGDADDRGKGKQGVRVEAAEIDRFLEERRRAFWMAAGREETR